MRTFCTVLVASAMWVTGAWGQAQTTFVPPPRQEIPEAAPLVAANLGNEPVGPGDLIYLSVTGSPELSRSYRVSSDGNLTLPLVKENIPVAGMRPAAVAKAVTDALIRERILVSPIVSAEVHEYRSRQVSVVGAVKAPVIVQAVGDMKLLDAIARAQGFAPEAGPEVIVSRPGNAPGTTDTIKIPIKDLLAGNKPELNVPLHGGEQIRVPDAPKMYVVGNVKMPGAYPLNEMEGSSVLKALALSQGTLRFTAKNAYIYRLTAGSNQRQEISVPLQEILARKTPDVQLQPNDVLYIPENAKARLSANVLDRITGFGSSVGSGLAVYH